MSRDKIRHRQIFPSDFSVVCVSNVKERVLKDGGRLYGFAKPTGPPSTEFFTWECVSVAILHSVFIQPAWFPLHPSFKEVKR